MKQIEIPEGWEEIYREMGGEAHKEKWGTVNVRFPHPHLDFSELIVEFLPTFLPPKTKVGIILIALSPFPRDPLGTGTDKEEEGCQQIEDC